MDGSPADRSPGAPRSPELPPLPAHPVSVAGRSGTSGVLLGPVIGHHVDPSGWRHGPLVGDVTGLATASPATGPGCRALGRARQVGRRRPGRVPRMPPHPCFGIPDAFLQTDDRCPLPSDGCQKLNNQCVQCGDHGRHHSPERGRKPTRHPTPVNGYGGMRASFLKFQVLHRAWVLVCETGGIRRVGVDDGARLQPVGLDLESSIKRSITR